jgi:non-canonical purine NTP pyrophosphatase (RdgB/HAM1 family)
MDLLIGTSNPGKLREISVLLAELPIKLLSLRDLGLDSLEIEEPFDTFEENAIHKAKAYAQASGRLAFADDSGLAVDALGGRPGVYSARYGGPTDHDRYLKLLGELENVPDERRKARFIAVAALVDSQNQTIDTARGVVEGRIARAPQEGDGGFGYDPIFIPEGYATSFATLSREEKNRISHRGRAVSGLIPALRRRLGS